MGRSLWYPPPSPLMLLIYCPDSKLYSDEKLVVLCGGQSRPTSSMPLLGKFSFCWLYLFIVFLVFILAQFQLQILEISIHICFFLFCQYIILVIIANDITDSNIHKSSIFQTIFSRKLRF